jgi:glutathione peroxidase-family protein
MRSLALWASPESRFVTWDQIADMHAADATSHSQWNFEKFLIDKNGKVVNRWASTTTPQAIDVVVEKLLAE